MIGERGEARATLGPVPLPAVFGSALRAGIDYVRRNPRELLFAAREAAGLRATIPLDALRWLVANLPAGRFAPRDVVIGQQPPAITLAGTFSFMGQSLRASAAIRVEELVLGPDELRVTIRVTDLAAEALGSPTSPLAMLLRSGSLDLSRPGKLLGFLPRRPAVIVEADEDRFVLDLLRAPRLAQSARLRRALSVIAPVLVIGDVSVEDDRLVVAWRPRLGGVADSVAALRG